MKATTFSRWLPAITSNVSRKTVLSVAGLAVAGGTLAGPLAPAIAGEHAPAMTPAAVTQSVADKPADKPGMDKLIPHGVQGAQSRIDLGDEQDKNAKAIVEATKKTGLDERAAVIAVATSLQESKLNNYGHLGEANDHDSQGLFQQRPSSGWGTVEQITNPEYATTAFLNGLKGVDGWHDMALTDAAQKVQVSAYPDAYAQWEQQAADIVANHWNS
jgi:hypothetical protein